MRHKKPRFYILRAKYTLRVFYKTNKIKMNIET